MAGCTLLFCDSPPPAPTREDGSATTGAEAQQPTRVEPVTAAAQVVLRGIPTIAAGTYVSSTDSWYSSPASGTDARLLGVLANTGALSATNVTITVNFKDMASSFLGRASPVRVGTIPAGGSETFEVFKKDVFPAGGQCSRAVEVEITCAETDGPSLWTCRFDRCTSP